MMRAACLVVLACLVAAVAAEQDAESAIKCLGCHWMVQEARQELAPELHDAAAVTALLSNELCLRLPAVVRGVCTDLPTEKLAQQLVVMPQTAPVSSVCHAAAMCDVSNPEADEFLSQALRALISAQEAAAVGDTWKCGACKSVIGVVATIIGKNVTKEAIEHALISLCPYMGPLSTNCLKMVERFGPHVIDVIISTGAQPAKVCYALGACESPYLEPDADPSAADASSGGIPVADRDTM